MSSFEWKTRCDTSSCVSVHLVVVLGIYTVKTGGMSHSIYSDSDWGLITDRLNPFQMSIARINLFIFSFEIGLTVFVLNDWYHQPTDFYMQIVSWSVIAVTEAGYVRLSSV